MRQRPRIVCLGEALVDLKPPPGSDHATSSRITANIGGAPLNVAVHLKRAGADPVFLGTISNDSFGDRIANTLDRKRIERQPARRVNAPTRLAVVEHREGQPPFRFYGHRPADTRLTLRDVGKAITAETRALYVGSLMMIDRRASAVQMEAIRIAREIGTVAVVCDPNPRRSAWNSTGAMILATERIIANAWITKISLDDARALGWPDEPAALIHHLKDRTSGYTIITDGPNGCWMEHEGTIEHVAIPAQPVVDPTGAGDAFFARIIHNAVRDQAITPETLHQAAHEGARIATKHGAF